jgi:hypothetical protein
MFDNTQTVEEMMYRELRELREAERSLCAAFETLQAEVPANTVIGLL